MAKTLKANEFVEMFNKEVGMDLTELTNVTVFLSIDANRKKLSEVVRITFIKSLYLYFQIFLQFVTQNLIDQPKEISHPVQSYRNHIVNDWITIE